MVLQIRVSILCHGSEADNRELPGRPGAQSLVGELRSHEFWGMTKKKKKRTTSRLNLLNRG